MIGIPFYVWDLAEQFHRDVVQDFVDEYARGHTPNPCLRCNEKIKFAAVLDRAVALGFDAVCTGHHARLVPAAGDVGVTGGPGVAGGRGVTGGPEMAGELGSQVPQTPGPRLARSVDPAKDQSYVLAVLTSEQLARAMFPLGDSTKAGAIMTNSGKCAYYAPANLGGGSPMDRSPTASPRRAPGRWCGFEGARVRSGDARSRRGRRRASIARRAAELLGRA